MVFENMEWNVAGLNCRSLHKDAHLVAINDAAEQTMVERFIGDTRFPSQLLSLYTVSGKNAPTLKRYSSKL